jgi:hypothetical protein
MPAMQAANSSTFLLRDLVAATAADVSTIWRRSTARWFQAAIAWPQRMLTTVPVSRLRALSFM